MPLLPTTLHRAAPNSLPQQARSPMAIGIALAFGAAALSLRMATAAFGQVPATLSGGPPVQVVPYVTEPGVPSITITPGTANPFSGADGSGGAGSGGGSNGSTGGNVGSSDALEHDDGHVMGQRLLSAIRDGSLACQSIGARCHMRAGERLLRRRGGSGSGAQARFSNVPGRFPRTGLHNRCSAAESELSPIRRSLQA